MAEISRTTLQVGTFEVNCSLVTVGKTTYVVDPGSEGERIAATLAELGLTPSAILLTHAHFDHIGGIAELQRRFPDLPVYAHPGDWPAFTHPMNQYPPDYPPVARPSGLRDARELDGITVIETPGHTPGGVCYHFPEGGLLLAGDTLFAGSAGRTDLPGGDMAALMDSLGKLKLLPPTTVVIPGHGPFTTIADELVHNPFLRG